MKILRSLVLPAAFSLALFAGCNPENPDLPDPKLPAGYCQDGWDAYEAGDYELALENFQAAIDLDVTYPEGYLGAGWAMIHMADYWLIADNYFYMAIQQDAGFAPLVERNEMLVQDTMWTVFECLDPQLPPEVLDPILEQLGTMGPEWVGEEIYDIVTADGQPDIPYRFHTDYEIPVALLSATNNFSLQPCDVDSIVPDGEGGTWVYLNGNYRGVKISDEVTIPTWICADNEVVYDYSAYEPSELSQDSYDALAGWIMLQHARGSNGSALTANAAVWVLDRELDTYTFGAGTYREGLEDINLVQLKGMAAATSFNEKIYPFAWFDCTSEGYGLQLNRFAPEFLFQLVQVIESMIVFEG